MSDYWKHYHLSSDPFASDNPEIRPYISERWQQQLELLLHLSTMSNTILVLTGVLGVGKTLLLREFIAALKRESGVCEVRADSNITPTVLLQIMASNFGIHYQDLSDQELKVAIETVLHSMSQQGKRYLLAVDNAHKLPEATQELILQFATEHTEPVTPLSILLVGGPQLGATLSNITTEHMGEELTHTQRVEAMTRQETAQYIEHRLAAVGVPSSSLLTEKDIDEIYRQSGGVPIKVNFFAKNTLLKYLPSNVSGLSSKAAWMRMARRHWPVVLGSCVLLALLTALIVTPKTNQLLEGAQHSTAATKGTLLPTAELSTHGDALTDDDDDSLDDNNELAQDETSSSTEAPQQLAMDSEQQQAASMGVTNDDVAVPTRPQTSPQQPSPQLPPQSVTPEAATPGAAAVPPPAPAAPTMEDITSAPMPAKKPMAVKQPAVRPTTVAHATVIPVTSHHHATASAVDATATQYTLQLLAAASSSQASHFIATHRLGSQARVYHINSQGKTWFVVVYGGYPNQMAAKMAVKNLPRELQQSTPWVRSLKSLTDNKVG